jgi:RNA polymerase sigma-70 factor (ECF subfamily)
MDDLAQPLSAPFVAIGADLEREFEARIAECSTLSFRVAYSVLRNREDAEETTQEAFARAYRNFAKLRDRSRFRAWLVRITWRLAIDKQRAAKRRSLREQIHLETSEKTACVESAISHELAKRVWRAVDGLPEKLRSVTILAGIEEYNTREVAELLGLPEGTVKSRLHEARQRLRKELQ